MAALQHWRWLQFWQWQSHRGGYGSSGAAVLPSNTPPPPPPAGRATSTEVCVELKLPQCLRLPLQFHHPLLWLLPLFHSLHLLFSVTTEVTECSLQLPIPALPELPLSTIEINYLVLVQTENPPCFPLAQKSCLRGAVFLHFSDCKAGVTGSLMYRVCISVLLPLLFAHFYC